MPRDDSVRDARLGSKRRRGGSPDGLVFFFSSFPFSRFKEKKKGQGSDTLFLPPPPPRPWPECAQKEKKRKMNLTVHTPLALSFPPRVFPHVLWRGAVGRGREGGAG